MPWRDGATPVATVVQSTGDQVGLKLYMSPYAPSRMSDSRCGSFPAASSGSAKSHPAPSQPMIIQRRGSLEAEGAGSGHGARQPSRAV